MLRAALDAPAWADEPIASLLADALAASPRAVRLRMEACEITLDVPGALVGRLDETWLLRTSAPESLSGLEGVVAWTQLEGDHAFVRTFAQGAVEREKVLRALHKALGARPVMQLHRAPHAAPRKKLVRSDGALLHAMRATPYAPIDALAKAAEVAPRVAKERVAALVAERALVVRPTPRDTPRATVLVRVSPESSAAARHALAPFERAILRAHVPDVGEAARVDAELVGARDDWPAMRERALDVPGVKSVEVLPV
ncbi:MAG TPA: hypothetical protein VM370_03570, partial [Candidatus Thermoplasmatota archaeon]|nr:hypothetical protein [Candidatus Thermoplasmatota archaeon]